MAKSKRIQQEKYKKGTLLEPQTVSDLITNHIETVSTEILERGIYDNGDEYMNVKIYIPK